MENAIRKEIMRPQINNEVYDTLGEDWIFADDDPVALLRAEGRLKNPWVLSTIADSKCTSDVRVLDIGCGAGLLTNYLAAQTKNTKWEIHGVDMSAPSLEIAKKYDATHSVDYKIADAYNLPFPDATFDAVSAMDFLEHVENPDRVIQEASRVLKPGGLFLFHTFNKNILAYLIVIKLVEWLLPKTPKNMHILRLFIKPQTLAAMCESSQLKVIKLMGIKPDIFKLDFFLSIFQRRVRPGFSFSFTSSTLLSYIGYAKKVA
jgi:2-polyprenyl-6-hydroxyphenyl methylase/3-demethylubiquinone-9 3-methyltransferase